MGVFAFARFLEECVIIDLLFTYTFLFRNFTKHKVLIGNRKIALRLVCLLWFNPWHHTVTQFYIQSNTGCVSEKKIKNENIFRKTTTGKLYWW